MSKKKREIERKKKELVKQQKRRQKAARQKNDPLKWKEKKAARQDANVTLWMNRYRDVRRDCPIKNTTTIPSEINCQHCMLWCEYNRN
jgi:hypothetical protein